MNRTSFFIGNNLFVQIATICVVGLLLGVVALFLPPLWTVAVVAGGIFIFAMVKRPEIGLLGILVATSSIVFEDTLPLLPIGPVGSLHIPDLILIALLILVFIRWLAEKDSKLIHTPLDLPLFAFYSVALLSTIIAINQSSVELVDARRAIRVITYYLSFFIVTNLVRRDRQILLLLKGILLLSTLVALMMLAQYFIGTSVAILPGRVETLTTWGEAYKGITRILPPGQSIILVSFITMTIVLVVDRLRPLDILKIFQWGLLGVGILLTFNRSFWVGVVLALFLLFYLGEWKDKYRLVKWGLLLLLFATIVFFGVTSSTEVEAGKLISAAYIRLSTLIKPETLSEASIQARYRENEYAFPQIASQPLLGLGLGARYRPWDTRLDVNRVDARGYIHNGHLWLMLKTGLIGYLFFVWLSITFIFRGFKYWRYSSNSEYRGIVLGFTVTYLVVLIGAIVNPMLMQWFWTPVIGIMMGVNEVILREAGLLPQKHSQEKN